MLSDARIHIQYGSLLNKTLGMLGENLIKDKYEPVSATEIKIKKSVNHAQLTTTNFI